MDLKLVVFDVDGTLVDSQSDITGAMTRAFAGQGLTPPTTSEVLGIVGLSLPEAMHVLAPDHADLHNALVQGYKDAYIALRAENGVALSSPLYPGVREVLAQLQAQDDVLLGVATGKSKRGLDKLIDGHGLHGLFVTQQVSDHHPSKPHPAMLLEAVREAGLDVSQAVMVGDTAFDMEMARSARVHGIGVTYGYHSRDRLGAAAHLIDHINELPTYLDTYWRQT